MHTVLVVGATGFIGAAACRALSAAPDVAVIAASRRPGPGVRVIDPADPASLKAAAAGATAIVNAAAGPPWAMLRLAEAVRDVAGSGGQQVIHLSSMAVYGAAAGRVREDAPLAAGGSSYAAGKIACERTLAGLSKAAILRPGIVYGPGDQQWTGRLCRLLRAGRLGDLGEAGDGFCNLVHVDDVAAAILACLCGGASGAFNLASPHPPRWNAVFATLAAAIGAVALPRIGHRRLALEARALVVPLQIGKLAGARLRLPPGLVPEPIPPSLLALFAQHIRLDPARADTLGFARTPDEAGLISAARAWEAAASGPAR